MKRLRRYVAAIFAGLIIAVSVMLIQSWLSLQVEHKLQSTLYQPLSAISIYRKSKDFPGLYGEYRILKSQLTQEGWDRVIVSYLLDDQSEIFELHLKEHVTQILVDELKHIQPAYVECLIPEKMDPQKPSDFEQPSILSQLTDSITLPIGDQIFIEFFFQSGSTIGLFPLSDDMGVWAIVYEKRYYFIKAPDLMNRVQIVLAQVQDETRWVTMIERRPFRLPERLQVKVNKQEEHFLDFDNVKGLIQSCYNLAKWMLDAL